MSAVEPLANRVAVLFNGKLAACGSLDELLAAHRTGKSLEEVYHEIARERFKSEEVCV